MPSAITLRLTTADPVPGVAYSLQDKTNAPVDPASQTTVRSVSTSSSPCPMTDG